MLISKVKIAAIANLFLCVSAIIVLTCCRSTDYAPENDITGQKMKTTYVPEWSQAISTRHHADIPFSWKDRSIVGRWSCDVLGGLGMVYEYVGRDPESKSVEFVGTKQSEEIRQRLEHIGDEIRDLMDYIDTWKVK